MKELDTKQRIIQAARKTFADKGFQGATTAEIAKQAGISEGTIYRHFNKKEDLLLECVTPILENIIDNMEHDFPEVDNLREFVKENLKLRLKLFEEHYDTFRILMNELPYSKEMANQYMMFLSKQEEKINNVLTRVKDLGKVKRTRNSLLFGLGQAMTLWLFMNFRNWSKDGQVKFSNDMLRIEEDHVIEDLTDYIMYGISGVPDETADLELGGSSGE